MPYLKYIIILIVGVLIGNVINYKIIPSNEVTPLSAITSVIYTNSYSLGLLHRIKLGQINTATTWLETNIARDTLIINDFIKQTSVTEDEKTLATSQINLLSVMNEKFNIPLWKNNKELISVFTDFQKKDPEHIKWFRCKNWNKPMWSEDNSCKNNQ